MIRVGMLAVMVAVVGLGSPSCSPPSSPVASEIDASRPHIDRLAIWVRDTEKMASFFKLVGWNRHPMRLGLGEGYGPVSKEIGTMAITLFDANGLWLDVVEPIGPGPGTDLLKASGSGSIQEMAIEVASLNAQYDRLRAEGIHMVNMDGSPLDDREKGFSLGPNLERIAYFPPEVSYGTSVELYQRVPSPQSLLARRDSTWKPSMRTPKIAPRIDRVILLARNVKRTAQFYTATVGWTQKGNVGLIDTNGFTIEIIEPKGDPDLEKLLQEHGDGYMMAISAEVADIEGFYDRMRTQGVTMVDFNDRPLPTGKKAVTLPSGERFNYFPLSTSDGLRVRLFQRSGGAH